jgi:hypothetical protein
MKTIVILVLGAVLTWTASAQSSCCATSCKPSKKLSGQVNKNLKVVSGLSEIKTAFNQQTGKKKFIAILSSTCDWCLQGAASVQQTILSKMNDKNISVMIIWTNMLNSDDLSSAHASSAMFQNTNVTQFFDSKNKLGVAVAKSLNAKHDKAWDIYMFFDENTTWDKAFPAPSDYAHQLSASTHPWIDETKYFCGPALKQRLDEMVSKL